MTSQMERDLGATAPRNPDALPPRNIVEEVATWLHTNIGLLTRGNSLFALKGGVLTGKLLKWDNVAVVTMLI